MTAIDLTGYIVYGRPVFGGKIQPRRKGIVLGAFASDTTTQVVVWWYGLGAASTDTCSLMHPSELKSDGDIFNLSWTRAWKLSRGCYGYPRAYRVGSLLEGHARRMKHLSA